MHFPDSLFLYNKLGTFSVKCSSVLWAAPANELNQRKGHWEPWVYSRWSEAQVTTWLVVAAEVGVSRLSCRTWGSEPMSGEIVVRLDLNCTTPGELLGGVEKNTYTL